MKSKTHKSNYSVVFENDNYLILNKAAGTLVIPDRYDQTKICLVHLLNEKYPNIFIVHRIDKDTSGIICFAKNEISHKHLSQLFESRKVDKKYIAICASIPEPLSGTISIPIRPSKTNKSKMICDDDGKEAITEYETIEKLQSASLVHLKIKTGRTHQIRVHLQHINCPLLVDEKYGNNSEFLLSRYKGRKYNQKKYSEERPLMSRHSLHSWKISFKDQDGNTIRGESELPKDFKAVLNQLRKLSKQD